MWLESAAVANIKLRSIDVVARRSSEEVELYNRYAKGKALPYVVVQRPSASAEAVQGGNCLSCSGGAGGCDEVLIEGPLDVQAVATVLNSVTRGQIINHIAGGSIAVWVLVLSEDEKKNREFMQTLGQALDQAEQQVIEPEKANGRIRPEWGQETSLPVVLVDQKNSTESFFMSQLLGGCKGTQLNEPIAVAVFGQGRWLDPVNADALERGVIHEQVRYLVGPCSCEAKKDNPGRDLLLAFPWNQKIQKTIVDKDQVDALPLPSMNGILPEPVDNEDNKTNTTLQ